MPVIPSPVDGIDLRYDISGDGPALVLLHGSVLTRAIWRGLGYLAPLIAEHTVIRIDLRGHGLSGAPHDPGAYTQEVFVADLLAVLDAEGVGRAALMGYSLGARVALSTALEHPGRVRRLVSLGGSASAQRGAVDSVFFPGVIEALREDGMEAFCAGQGLGPEVTSRRARATRTAFLAADHRAVAALLERHRRDTGGAAGGTRRLHRAGPVDGGHRGPSALRGVTAGRLAHARCGVRAVAGPRSRRHPLPTGRGARARPAVPGAEALSPRRRPLPLRAPGAPAPRGPRRR